MSRTPEPADETAPIADAIRNVAFLICIPFAGCTLAWSLLQLVLA